MRDSTAVSDLKKSPQRANFGAFAKNPDSAALIDDKQLRSHRSEGAVWLRVVGDLIGHARFQNEPAAVLQFGVQLAFDTQQDMSFHTPVVGEIAGRVFHHAHAERAELARAPESEAGLAFVFGRGEVGPVRRAKGEAV